MEVQDVSTLDTRFLSTLSLRRATAAHSPTPRAATNFYPRSPCGERPMISSAISCRWPFLSTLSLRRATATSIDTLTTIIFLSTLSLRRATCYLYVGEDCTVISIHALLAESDDKCHCGGNRRGRFLSTLSLRRATSRLLQSSNAKNDFYPRSPCGERHLLVRLGYGSMDISIHALLAESDGD